MADKQRLIYADKFWNRLIKSRYDFFTYPDGRCGYSVSTIADALWRTESVDAVDVVRCRDCANRHSSEFCECRPEDGYCNDGERKDNES